MKSLPKRLVEVQSGDHVIIHPFGDDRMLVTEVKTFFDDWIVLTDDRVFSRDTGREIDLETRQEINRVFIETPQTAEHYELIKRSITSELQNLNEEVADIENGFSQKLVAFILRPGNDYRRIKKHLPPAMIAEINALDLESVLCKIRDEEWQLPWDESEGYEI